MNDMISINIFTYLIKFIDIILFCCWQMLIGNKCIYCCSLAKQRQKAEVMVSLHYKPFYYSYLFKAHPRFQI